MSWLDQYLLGGYRGDQRHQRMWTYDLRLLFLAPDGSVKAQQEPAPINQWKKHEEVSVSFAATRAGVVWTVRSAIRGRSSDHAGIYIEEGGKLVRFMRGAEMTQRGVAPGGCGALVTMEPQRLGARPTELRLIELCTSTFGQFQDQRRANC